MAKRVLGVGAGTNERRQNGADSGSFRSRRRVHCKIAGNQLARRVTCPPAARAGLDRWPILQPAARVIGRQITFPHDPRGGRAHGWIRIGHTLVEQGSVNRPGAIQDSQRGQATLGGRAVSHECFERAFSVAASAPLMPVSRFVEEPLTPFAAAIRLDVPEV